MASKATKKKNIINTTDQQAFSDGKGASPRMQGNENVPMKTVSDSRRTQGNKPPSA
jgi:hypothetical protein